MVYLIKNFDAYSLKARVFPALIAGLPALALLFVLVPWDHLGLSHAIAAVMGFVLLFAFSDVARSRGKKIQEKLGSGETAELWHRSNLEIPEISKARFREYVASQLKQKAPSYEDEEMRPAYANEFYRSAGVFLRDQTRDTDQFPILFGENITYGFRRNLLGLKSISLIMNGVVFLVCVALLCISPVAIFNAGHSVEKLSSVVIAAVLHSIYMIFAVNKNAVFSASKAYGRQLILSCDAVMKLRKDVRDE